MTPTLVTSCTALPPEGANFPRGGPAENCPLVPGTTLHLDEKLGERALSKLKWRTRRGLLENDLIIERFFAKHEQTITVRQANSLNALMDLSDNDLLDLHLARKSLHDVRPEFDTADIQLVLNLLKQKS